jgi:hypothetical protein
MPLAVTDRDYWVSITSVSCNYGRLRFWFIRHGWKNGISCPAPLPEVVFIPEETRFCVSSVHELTYESTSNSRSRF